MAASGIRKGKRKNTVEKVATSRPTVQTIGRARRPDNKKGHLIEVALPDDGLMYQGL